MAAVIALEAIGWIYMIATTILAGIVYLYIYLVTRSSGTKVEVTKFSQILPGYNEMMNAVFKKKKKKKKRNATTVIYLPFTPINSK